MAIDSLLSRKPAIGNGEIQKRMKQLKKEGGEDVSLEAEYGQVMRQIEEQGGQKTQVEQQNTRLQAEIEEVSRTMETIFGEDILSKEPQANRQIDYKNIRQENVKQKVERERQQKKDQDEFKEVKEELAEMNRQCRDYQQQISRIKVQVNENSNRDQVVRLSNENKQQTDDLKTLRKTLETVTKQNLTVSKEIQQVMDQMGYEEKLVQWKEERQTYREKIKEQVIQKNLQDKRQQQQQDELGWLSKNYKEVCKKAKVSDCLDLNKAREQEEKQEEETLIMEQYKIMQKGLFKKPAGVSVEKGAAVQKMRGRQYQSKKPEDESIPDVEETLEVYKEQNEENLKNLLEALKKTKAEYDQKKSLAAEQTEHNAGLMRQLEFDKKDLLNRLKEKEKEVNIQMSRLNEIKRTAKTSPLLEKGLALENEVGKNSHANLNYLKGILVESTRRHTKREAVGAITLSALPQHKNMMVFDDQLILSDDLVPATRMTSIRLFTLKHNIVGIQAIYMVDKTVVEGMASINSHHLGALETLDMSPSGLEVAKDPNSLEVLTLEIQPGDFLRFISGVSSEVIDFLKLETNLGKRVQTGKMEKGCKKEFHLELKRDQQVVTLFGGLDYRRQAVSPHETCLAFLGVETMSGTTHLRKGGALQKYNT